MKKHEPDTAGRHSSLLLQILSCASTEDTCGSLNPLDLPVQECESSTGTPRAKPLKVILVQRRVKAADVLNHFVMHASRLNTCASVCEEVRNIMFTRATLLNTAQPKDIRALEQGKGKQPSEGPREKANENPDKDVHCFYCWRKGHRKRECRKRVRHQRSGQEALGEDETRPSCEAYAEEEENS